MLNIFSWYWLVTINRNLKAEFTESRKVFNLPPVTIFPYQNLPQIFEVLVVDRAWIWRGSRYKLRENILVRVQKSFWFIFCNYEEWFLKIFWLGFRDSVFTATRVKKYDFNFLQMRIVVFDLPQNSCSQFFHPLHYFLAESRKVLSLPPVTICPYQNLPPIFEVVVVVRAGLGRGSRYKFRENILVSYSYGFELMVIVTENKLVLE